MKKRNKLIERLNRDHNLNIPESVDIKRHGGFEGIKWEFEGLNIGSEFLMKELLNCDTIHLHREFNYIELVPLIK